MNTAFQHPWQVLSQSSCVGYWALAAAHARIVLHNNFDTRTNQKEPNTSTPSEALPAPADAWRRRRRSAPPLQQGSPSVCTQEAPPGWIDEFAQIAGWPGPRCKHDIQQIQTSRRAQHMERWRARLRNACGLATFAPVYSRVGNAATEGTKTCNSESIFEVM